MLEKCLTWRCCHWVHLHPTMRKEMERGQTEGRCDDWVVDFPPEWNHMELTSQWSPSCPSVSHCSLGMVAVGSGTEGRSQVHMEHFDSVALTPGPGGEGTGKGGIKKENWVGGGRSMGNWERGRVGKRRHLRGGNWYCPILYQIKLEAYHQGWWEDTRREEVHPPPSVTKRAHASKGFQRAKGNKA